jgi:hypothetical protein
MNDKTTEDLKAAALAKLRQIQRAPGYKSFFNASAVEAFGRVESTAFAGTPVGSKT